MNASNMKERNSSRRFWNEYIKIYRFWIIVSILLIAIVAISSSFYPLTINWSFKLIEDGNGKYLFIVMLIVPLIALIRGLSNYLQILLVNKTALSIVGELQKTVYAKFIQANIEIIDYLIDNCMRNSGTISIDPSYNYAQRFDSFKRNFTIDYFFPNQKEASIITGMSNYKDSATILLKKNIRNVIITLGRQGCYFSNKRYSKLYKTKSIASSTLSIGAGDYFVSGFLSAKLRKLGIDECILEANKSAREYLKGSV